jgi:hypothetical protein
MITRHSDHRKYRPGFETMERIQLQSGGIATIGITPPPPAAVQVAAVPQDVHPVPCGTGRGIVIVTH